MNNHKSGSPAGEPVLSWEARMRRARRKAQMPEMEYIPLSRDWKFWLAIAALVAVLTTLFIVTWVTKT